jgi:hypothetical protein
MRIAVFAIAVLLHSIPLEAAPSKASPRTTTLVVCAPGYPGTTAEAQPSMDTLAATLGRLAGWAKDKLAAVYYEGEKAGLARLAEQDAAVALVPLPFFVKHRDALKLTARMQVQMKGSAATEVWSLVVKKGKVTSPAGLEGYTIISTVGYSPDFVRGSLGGWGRIPSSVAITQSALVISALRKAAAGEKLAVFVDAAQVASLGSLPFASEIEVVARSVPLPAGFVCTVGSRMKEARWTTLGAALEKLATDPQGQTVLDGIRMTAFSPVDAKTLEAVRRLK